MKLLIKILLFLSSMRSHADRGNSPSGRCGGDDAGDGRWHDTDPTSTVFTVGSDSEVNQSGQSYVAYLFAHNDDDGGFGSTGDQDIIKCGSYTGNANADGPEIDLGFALASWRFVSQKNVNFLCEKLMKFCRIFFST